MYLDFQARFPAVSKLLNCREISCAASLEFPDFTAGARQMLERVELEDCFRPRLGCSSSCISKPLGATQGGPSPSYSHLNATIGSTLAARRAGSSAARKNESPSTDATPTKVGTSHDCTP